LTQTRPWPPPAAGLAAALVPAARAGAGVAAAGLAAAEVLGLNKSPSFGLAGDGEAVELAAAVVFARARFTFGEAVGVGD